MLKVGPLGVPLERFLGCIEVPICEEIIRRSLADNLTLTTWAGVGWVSGEIASANSDARLRAGHGGGKVNFVALYSDETEGKHGFTLDNYGEKELGEDGQWVLLEYAGED